MEINVLDIGRCLYHAYKKSEKGEKSRITRRVDKWWDDRVFDDVIVTLSHTIAHFNEGRDKKIRGISLHPF